MKLFIGRNHKEIGKYQLFTRTTVKYNEKITISKEGNKNLRKQFCGEYTKRKCFFWNKLGYVGQFIRVFLQGLE